jgi:outer membrane receptor for ferrienterochelin and colicins
LSTYINYENVLNGLSIGAGVFDILGQNYQFIQAHRSFSDPLPGPSREYMVRLRYKFSFNA